MRLKIEPGDPVIDRWLEGQRSASGSVKLLIKVFSYLHGDRDVSLMGFGELLGGGVRAAGPERPEKGEAPRGEPGRPAAASGDGGWPEARGEERKNNINSMLSSMM